ncbi:hypothetical protein ABZ614_11415 [Streptomyces sp. NPDC013178]|uniref:ATP-grasp domain-containing protein n=1 Tax=Streptomyces sp. NPDC013178 TaxID=3155118 RepID=UPI0033F8CF92
MSRSSGTASASCPDLLIINGEVLRPEHSAGPGLSLDEATVHFCGIDDLAFHVGTGRTSVRDVVSGQDLADFGLIQIASYPRPTATLLSAVSAYLKHRGRPGPSMAAISAPTKLYQLVVLAQHGLPVPATVHLSRATLRDSYPQLVRELGLPFVLKAVNASGGRLNFLIETEVDFLHRTEDPAHTRVPFLAQAFVPNNGTFRVLVLGGDAALVMHRCNTDGSHLTNTEQGHHATLFEVETFDVTALELAARAASVLDCEIAGINMVQDRHTGEWFLLEVNASPAIGSGAFAAEKTRAYASYLQARLAQAASV